MFFVRPGRTIIYMTVNREKQRQELKEQGERLKARVKAFTATLDKTGQFKFKLALMEKGVSETVARRLMTGIYERHPRQELIEILEDVLANFGKAKAKVRAS